MNKLLFVATVAGAALAASAVPAASALKTAVFAGGCFWSMEKGFETTPGVVTAVSGYAGGTAPNPTYENHEGHLESIQVTYDPAVISYPQLVNAFFHHIDPTDPNGQICDQGPSYRTAVFTADATEKAQADQVKAQIGKELGTNVRTMILGPTKFWMGEGYHQHYAEKNPANYNAYRIGCGRDRTLRVVWGR